MPEIATLNRRITINKYLFAQDASGGNLKALTDSYQVWASVEQKSGSRTLDNMQVQYKQAYKVIKRYEASRVLSHDDEIVYEDAILSIGAVIEKEEGRKRFNEIVAYSNGKTVSGSTEIIYTVAQLVHYVADGDEFGFQDDRLKGYTLIIVFRDGVQFSYIITGTPIGKQALYDSTEGTIYFAESIGAMDPDEVVDVYLLK